MSEIPRDFRPVTPIPNYAAQHRNVPEFASIVVRCEDCPAAEICKKINNFRPSCDPKTGKKSASEYAEKCQAGTNILLWKMLELLSKER